MSDFFSVSPRTRKSCEGLRRELSTRVMKTAKYKESQKTPGRTIDNCLRLSAESTSHYQRAHRRHSASSSLNFRDGLQDLLDAYDKIANFDNSIEFTLRFGSKNARNDKGANQADIEQCPRLTKIRYDCERDSGYKSEKERSPSPQSARASMVEDETDITQDETDFTVRNDHGDPATERGIEEQRYGDETDSAHDETDFDDEEDEQQVSYFPPVAQTQRKLTGAHNNWAAPKAQGKTDLEESQLSLFDATGWE
jgi:hypothetical protein